MAFEGERKRTLCGTPNYIAPGGSGAATCGAWASSCTPCWSASLPSRPATSRPRACMMSSSAAILLSDSPVPQVQAHQGQLAHISSKMFIPDAAKDLIRLILQPEPSQRSTLDQIAAHEYLRVPMDTPVPLQPATSVSTLSIYTHPVVSAHAFASSIPASTPPCHNGFDFQTSCRGCPRRSL